MQLIMLPTIFFLVFIDVMHPKILLMKINYSTALTSDFDIKISFLDVFNNQAIAE